jgi:hypothetical protein
MFGKESEMVTLDSSTLDLKVRASNVEGKVTFTIRGRFGWDFPNRVTAVCFTITSALAQISCTLYFHGLIGILNIYYDPITIQNPLLDSP